MGVFQAWGFNFEDGRYLPNGLINLFPNSVRPYLPYIEYTQSLFLLFPVLWKNPTLFPLGYKDFPMRFFNSDNYKTYLAIVENRLDRLEELLLKGVNPTEVLFPQLGLNALALAAALDKIEAIDLILRFSDDIDNKSSNFGKTALHLATENGSIFATLLLLNRGANVLEKDDFNYDCLKKAAYRQNKEMQKIFENFKPIEFVETQFPVKNERNFKPSDFLELAVNYEEGKIDEIQVYFLNDLFMNGRFKEEGYDKMSSLNYYRKFVNQKN